MHLASLSASCAWPRMFPVSPLTAPTMDSVVSMLWLMADTSALIRLATSRMAAAWPLMSLAVPLILPAVPSMARAVAWMSAAVPLMVLAVLLIVPAVPLTVAPVPLMVLAVPRIEPACPSIDWASWTIWPRLPWSGWAVVRVAAAVSLVRVSWSTESGRWWMCWTVLAIRVALWWREWAAD